MKDSPELRRRHPEGARFSEWLAPDGWRHRRMDWPQPARIPVRGTLLFAGGRGDFIEKYLEAQAHWHSRGWNVTTFDWRGQGQSRGDIIGGNVDSFDPLVEDLAALLADLKQDAPGPHVAIAHSMGGHLLLRTLIEKRPALAAAVFVAPMIEVNSGPLPGGFTPWAAEWMCRLGWRNAPIWKPIPAPAFDRRRFLTSSPERYEDELYWWRENPAFNLGAPSWGWLRAASRSAAAFTSAALAKVDLPLLLLATQADRLVSADAIGRVASWLPHAELEMFQTSAHEILREADRVRLAALARIDAFFDAHAR